MTSHPRPVPPSRILSIQSDILGHKSYVQVMRRAFAEGNEGGLEMDSFWLHEDPELASRIAGHLLTRRVPLGPVLRANLDLHRFRSELGLGLWGRRLALRKMRLRAYSVLHFHTQVGGFLCGNLMRRIPTVLSGDMTTAQAAREMKRDFPPWTSRPSIALEKRAFKSAARIVMWSRWAANSVIDEYGIDAEKVRVVYPGVDLNALSQREPSAEASAAQVDQEAGRRKSKRPVRLLFMGSNFQGKGGDDVLDVFLNGLSDSSELHIVSGSEIGPRQEHPAVFVHRGVEAYTPEWFELYRSADVFVLPTRADAFGLVFLEAMAMGLPIVATSINAIPEIVSHGQTGFLVPPGDRVAIARHLRELIDNPDLRRRMGEEGRRVASRTFEARANFQQLAEVFREAEASSG